MNYNSINDFNNVVKWSYSLARKWVIEHLVPEGVTSKSRFIQYARKGKLPRHFPKRPDDYFRYRGTWKDWYDFFGKNKEELMITNRYLSYEEAMKVVQEKGIRNSVDYRNWKSKPGNLPSRPELHYKKKWQNWKTFLGEKYYVESPRHFTKLDESKVRVIKSQLHLGVPGKVLADFFGVSEMQISRIKHGENWSEI